MSTSDLVAIRHALVSHGWVDDLGCSIYLYVREVCHGRAPEWAAIKAWLEGISGRFYISETTADSHLVRLYELGLLDWSRGPQDRESPNVMVVVYPNAVDALRGRCPCCRPLPQVSPGNRAETFSYPY